MKQSPWEGNLSLATQEIRRVLWNPKIPYYIQKRLPSAPILIQTNPGQASSSYFLKIDFNIVPIYAQVFQMFTFRQTSSPKSYTSISCLAYVLHDHSFLLYLIAQILFVDQYRSQGSSTCSLLQSPFTSSLLGQNFLSCNLFLYTPSLCFCLKKISIWRKIGIIEKWNSKERGI